ncbi:BspA family leucine-rich repeat surface protein [Mycoplasma feriruminatoris]|uniref:BspA family leucine-rich repeat surface protein n=1 Tax=Mycoplasma feriruminatoris TaxID=1179777 RepID=A0ABY8HY07_9MOLU|nr:BspA family leucine-rich repeat surface protein [Mycoplasma feriruminatoris]WFQ93720.1 BspA family leucine-rich repeat surface protein [Mycoplasma feriruminatoris]
MKKMLTMLTSFSLITTSSILVVSCKIDGLDKKNEQSKKTPDPKANKEENKNDGKAPGSREEAMQSDEPKNGEHNNLVPKKDTNSHFDSKNNTFSSIEDESFFLKKYFKEYNDWLKERKDDNSPHFINPKDSTEVLILGYETTTNPKDGIKLKQIPTNVNKVPKSLPKKVTSLESAFKDNVNGQISGIEFWDTSHIKNMYQTFFGAKKFNQDISNWNTDNVDNMNYMFGYAESFNQDLSKWKAIKSPYPTGFAKEAGFKNTKVLWPQFKNK